MVCVSGPCANLLSSVQATLFILGGSISAIAALAHLGIIVSGAPAYRFFRAPDSYADAVTRGSRKPHVVTAIIATILFTWSAYAFSAAGIVAPLPLLPWIITAITAVYMIRGLALLLQLYKIRIFTAGHQVVTRDLVFSSIVLLAGFMHLVATIDFFRNLSGTNSWMDFQSSLYKCNARIPIRSVISSK